MRTVFVVQPRFVLHVEQKVFGDMVIVEIRQAVTCNVPYYNKQQNLVVILLLRLKTRRLLAEKVT